ncbi:ATP-binding cassette domain-containing protein [Nostoc ellipsosporum NOK]|nr:ATP-binding cassette domain-containing protein [Nostoc ellipsosporum NOK]
MTISLSDAGKRYNRDWIFRHFTYTFESGTSYAITGPNGSGKSTILQVLSGNMMLNEGKINYTHPDTTTLVSEKVYREVSICAPYLDVVEEMTLREFLDFHTKFKPLLPGLSVADIPALITLESARDKQIRYYSSGMKQRVKLAQCLFSDTALVLLDEPCTNLDQAGIALYHQLVDQYGKGRLLIVSSNDEVEYRFCERKVVVTDYK